MSNSITFIIRKIGSSTVSITAVKDEIPLIPWSFEGETWEQSAEDAARYLVKAIKNVELEPRCPIRKRSSGFRYYLSFHVKIPLIWRVVNWLTRLNDKRFIAGKKPIPIVSTGWVRQ